MHCAAWKQHQNKSCWTTLKSFCGVQTFCQPRAWFFSLCSTRSVSGAELPYLGLLWQHMLPCSQTTLPEWRAWFLMAANLDTWRPLGPGPATDQRSVQRKHGGTALDLRAPATPPRRPSVAAGSPSPRTLASWLSYGAPSSPARVADSPTSRRFKDWYAAQWSGVQAFSFEPAVVAVVDSSDEEVRDLGQFYLRNISQNIIRSLISFKVFSFRGFGVSGLGGSRIAIPTHARTLRRCRLQLCPPLLLGHRLLPLLLRLLHMSPYFTEHMSPDTLPCRSSPWVKHSTHRRGIRISWKPQLAVVLQRLLPPMRSRPFPTRPHRTILSPETTRFGRRLRKL